MFISIVLAFGNVQAALVSLSIAISVSVVAVILLWNRIQRSNFGSAWCSHTRSHPERLSCTCRLQPSVGKQGRTVTLRPAGTVMIEGSAMMWFQTADILLNSLIEVVETEGTRVVVREINEE